MSGEPKTPRHLLPSRPKSNLDGEGATWAVGAFVASLLIGLLIEPFRGTIGLENVVILYLLVVVAAAAIGGRAAGMVAAPSRPPWPMTTS